MRILFVGDIVGKGGRRAVGDLVPLMLKEYSCSFCIANGENSAGGAGITRKCINSLLDARVNVITGGDHMWDQREILDCLGDYPQVLRPANVSAAQPGRGAAIFNTSDGKRIGVISLLGRTFMSNSSADNPFEAADLLLERFRHETPVIIIDFHAEATSEKIAFARYVDGRASAVIGTHTHVPTADEQILPGGTAFHCDVGMVGARESVLGRAIEPVIQRFATGMPARFTVVETGIRLHGTLIDIGEDGRATAIQRVVRDLD